MKRIALVFALITSLLTGTVAIAAVKAGANCTKAGTTSIVSGKKFTCIKSGKKLVWDKGVVVKKPAAVVPETPKPEPSASPTPTPAAPKIDYKLDPRITTISFYEQTNVCKTSDLTPGGPTGPSSGFPRTNTPKSAKIIVIPISFTDYPYTETDATKLKIALDKTVNFYNKTSYGRFKLTFEFVDQTKWIKFDRTAASYNLPTNQPQQNNQVVVEDAFKIVDTSINFDNYDGVLMETSYFQIFNGGGQAFPGMKFATKNGTAKGVNFDFGTGVASLNTIPHELGHSLFNLEDLYQFMNANKPINIDPNPAGPWDMMSNSSQEFFGWSKWLMGFLQDSEVLCLKNQKESVQYLNSISDPNGNKLLTINLKEGVSLLAEVRLDAQMKFGLLIYKVDTANSHGDGPYIAEKTLLYSGSEKTFEGWKITVLGEDSNGLLFKSEKIG